MERKTANMDRYREEEAPYELWLCSFPNMGNRQMRKLVELCGSAMAVYYAETDRWRQVLREGQVQSLKQFTEAWNPKREYERLAAQDIGLVTLWDSRYPEMRPADCSTGEVSPETSLRWLSLGQGTVPSTAFMRRRNWEKRWGRAGSR